MADGGVVEPGVLYRAGADGARVRVDGHVWRHFPPGAFVRFRAVPLAIEGSLVAMRPPRERRRRYETQAITRYEATARV